jgi:RNA polymerase sigma-70 factor (ECF subfamily)
MSDVDLDLERFRNYLRILAEVQLSWRLKGKVDASDIVQQSLIEAHQGLETAAFHSEAELVAWLRTILAHNLMNVARDFGAQKRDVSRERSLSQKIDDSSARLEMLLPAEQSTPSQRAVKNETAARLADCLAQLPDVQRQAVVLRHFHGKSTAEIAERLERTEQAVAGLLKRGLQKLRELMAEGE